MGNDEFGAVGRAVNTMVEGLREREMVKTAFARYVSGQVLDTVLSSGQMPAVAGTRRRVTLLFSDIRGFTGIAEKLRPESVVETGEVGNQSLYQAGNPLRVQAVASRIFHWGSEWRSPAGAPLPPLEVVQMMQPATPRPEP